MTHRRLTACWLVMVLLAGLLCTAGTTGPDDHINIPVIHYNDAHDALVRDQLIVDYRRTALVVMDVWAGDTRIAGAGDITRERIAPLIAWAREHRVLVIYAMHGRAADPLVLPVSDGDLLSDGRVEHLAPELKQRGIKTLFYTGYAAELCLMLRPVGMATMRSMGFWPVLIEDATAAWGGPQALAVAVDMSRHGWCTATTAEVLATPEVHRGDSVPRNNERLR